MMPQSIRILRLVTILETPINVKYDSEEILSGLYAKGDG